MSTEKKEVTHVLQDLSRLSIIYLRSALNRTEWTNGLDDYISGCDALRAFPKLFIPADCQTDEKGLEWGGVRVDPITITDSVRDTCRKALKKTFEMKSVPINEHSIALIQVFSLKS